LQNHILGVGRRVSVGSEHKGLVNPVHDGADDYCKQVENGHGGGDGDDDHDHRDEDSQLVLYFVLRPLVDIFILTLQQLSSLVSVASTALVYAAFEAGDAEEVELSDGSYARDKGGERNTSANFPIPSSIEIRELAVEDREYVSLATSLEQLVVSSVDQEKEHDYVAVLDYPHFADRGSQLVSNRMLGFQSSHLTQDYSQNSVYS